MKKSILWLNISILLSTIIVLLCMSSCRKDEIEIEEEDVVTCEDGIFTFKIRFAPYGKEAAEFETRSLASENVSLDLGDDYFLNATLSANPVDAIPAVTTRAFEHGAKIRIIAYEQQGAVFAMADHAIYTVDGNALLREDELEDIIEVSPGWYKFVAYTYNNHTIPDIQPLLLGGIDPSLDLIWGESAVVEITHLLVEIPITMEHLFSQVKCVFTTRGMENITNIGTVSIPGWTAKLATETGVITNESPTSQTILGFTTSPNAYTDTSSTRTVFTGNPAANPTLVNISNLTVAGLKPVSNYTASFAKSLQQGVSYTLTMHIDKLPNYNEDPLPNIIPYVGAFWKNNQRGERLIRIPRPTDGTADGAWTAQVVEGRDWIVLDQQMTNDPHVGWRAGAIDGNAQMGNDSAFETNNDRRLPDSETFVSGNLGVGDEHIYFRIGLNSTRAPGTPPRYGIVLLTYAGNMQRQQIWIRQGESDDYVMRPADPNPSDGNTPRMHAMLFPPYNVADPLRGTGGNVVSMHNDVPFDAPLDRKMFTDYPSQAGYFYQWSLGNGLTPKAYHAVNTVSAIAGWDVTTKAAWDRSLDPCPPGYRHPDDASQSPSLSEFRQSLYATPVSNTYGPTHPADIPLSNSVFGYYADGFFDRLLIGTSPSGVSSSTVSYDPATLSSPRNAQIAYAGRLIYNPATHESIFLPMAGMRESNGALASTGARAAYWTSSVNGANGWAFYFTSSSFYSFNSAVQSTGASVRCVRSEIGLPGSL